MLKIILHIGSEPQGVLHKTVPDKATATKMDIALDDTAKAFKNQGFEIKRAEITNLEARK